MTSLMVQATSSGAGKTTLAAILCKHFTSKGVNTVPFKAQNISLNSYATQSGGEIGMSQAYQAWACNKEPQTDMNPVLIKPHGPGQSQTILGGRPFNGTSEEIEKYIADAYLRSELDNDLVIIEGSGSPAEINLVDRANMAVADMADAPVILVGDIEYGGVFAGLYGTYSLLSEKHRQRIKAFIINRFRGDMSLLIPGIDKLEKLIGVPCAGVLPHANLLFPSEDSLDFISGRGTEIEGTDIREAWLENLERIYAISQKYLNYSLIESFIDK